MSSKMILVYDASCVYCSAASDLVDLIDDEVRVVSWSSDRTQEFLTEQFDDTPFVMCLIDLETDFVCTGKEAMSELCIRAGIKRRLADRLSREYADVAPSVSSATNCRTPASFHVKRRIVTEKAKEAARNLYEMESYVTSSPVMAD